jgi:hypothetical protein
MITPVRLGIAQRRKRASKRLISGMRDCWAVEESNKWVNPSA